MTSRRPRGLWLRGIAAAAACLLALASTGVMVRAAVVAQTGSASTVVLTSQDDSIGNGHGDGKSHGDGGNNGGGNGSSHGDGKPKGGSKGEDVSAFLAKLRAEAARAKAGHSDPKSEATAKPVSHSNPTSHRAATPHPAAAQTAVPTPKVVVDSSDPAPFSAQAVSATEAARVLPVESLGPLSGISFGSGLFIWPLLLAVDVFALAVIARMALRRRLVSSED